MWLYFSRTRSISLLVISMSLAAPIVCIDGWWSRKRELGIEKRRSLGGARKIITAALAQRPLTTVRTGGLKKRRES